MKWRWILLTGLCLPVLAGAATVKLKNGTVYENVQITAQNDRAIEIKMQYGSVVLPLDSVKTIDGVPVAPPVKAPPPRPTPQPTAPVTTPPDSGEYRHQWTMDGALGVYAGVVGLWFASLLWLQKDADRRYRDRLGPIRKWNTIGLLLPFIGFVAYLFVRWREIRQNVALAAEAQAIQEGTESRKRGLFGGRASKVESSRFRKEHIQLEFLDDDRNPISINDKMPEMTGIEAARELLADAIVQRASDVHVEPHEKQFRVRFRIDGVLQERMTFEKQDGGRVLAALKTLAQIDVAEKRKAQDGRFRVRTNIGDMDFRAATAASIFGEKMTLRLLDTKGGLLGLEAVGMPKAMMDQFDRVIRSRSGIILATGPTGSGKTSTLYAALSRLDATRLNIMTIEDPVEYELDGATQIPVNAKAGVTYESGLRSILRQDPDVIFVGEMRDMEAATIALRAALTGHLVFSSLHTKNSLSSIVRLEEMGVERQQLASALLMVVAQRLVRTLCEDCREPYTPKVDEWQELGVELSDRIVYRAKGCPSCDATGYQGRTAIFELLVLDDPLRKAINAGKGEQEFEELARQRGWHSYREDGLEKILRGITTLDEVSQAS